MMNMMSEHEHSWVYDNTDIRQEWSEEFYKCDENGCNKLLTRHFVHTPNIVGGMDKRIDDQWIDNK